MQVALAKLLLTFLFSCIYSLTCFIMVPPPSCCNLFNKKGHNNCYKNLTKITENYHNKLSALHGLFVCSPCKTKVYKNKDSGVFQKNNRVSDEQIEVEKELDSSDCKEEENVVDNNFIEIDDLSDVNFLCKPVDNYVEKLKLSASFERALFKSPAKKLKLNLSSSGVELLRKSINVDSLFNIEWMNDFKQSLSQASSRQEKTFLLITFPMQWSVRKMAKESDVSRRMIKNAKKIQVDKGYGFHPEKKEVEL